MRVLYYRLLVLSITLLVASFAVQAQNVASLYYCATSSPISYVAVSALNSSTFIDLKGVGTYPNGPLFNNADDGIVLLGNFGTPNAIIPPFAFPMNNDFNGAGGAVGANGFYQPFRANTNGGGTVFTNSFNNPSTSGYYTNNGIINMIFGFCGDLDLTGASAEWYYAVQGSSPNRRIVLEWRNALIKGTSTTVTFQIILNESRDIDVVFGSASGTIPSSVFYTGINEGTAAYSSATTTIEAKSTNGQPGNYFASRFISNAWQHSTIVTNPYGSNGVWPTQSIRYLWKPKVNITAPALTLIDGANNTDDRTSVGLSLSRTYTVTNLSSSSIPVKVTASILGTGAAHYTVSPASVALLGIGGSQTFTVTFAPRGFGDLSATMRILVSTPDGITCPSSFMSTDVELRGRALGLSALAPLSVDFGTVAINSTHAKDVALFHNDASTPLTYYFTGPNPTSAEFSITGATGSPKVLSGTVEAGGVVSLPAAFSPSVNGVQEATVSFYYTDQTGTARSADQSITIIGEGTPSRVKFSKGASAAHISSGQLFAQSLFGAVGEEPLNMDFVLTNTGAGAAVRVHDFVFYELDRENPIQGRLRVDWTQEFGQGKPIASNDFRVQQYLNGAWTTVGVGDVVDIAAQEARPMRVQFVPDRRGVSFVRMFFATDATLDDEYKPIRALDAADRETAGIQSYDFYGITARNSRVETVAGLLFPDVEVGETATASIVVTNKGNARLLIEQNTLQLLDGDKDFRIESAFEGMEVDNGKYVIPVNQSGNIVIRFTPKHGGTRLSTLRFISNDSTEVKGVVGPRYIPITGIGSARASIAVESVAGGNPFSRDTAIVSVPTTYKEAAIRISNDGNSDLVLTEVLFEGSDIADYQLVNPFNPTTLKPNEDLVLTVRFSPQTGGIKRAEMLVHSNAINGVVRMRLEGFAGERLASASTAELFVEDSIAVGETKAGTLVIRNTGTVVLEVSSVNLGGANQSDYTVDSGSLPQSIEPQQTLSLPIELRGNERGSKTATITVMNNSTNEPVITATLGGFVGVRTNTHTPESISVSSEMGLDGRYEEKEVCVDITNTGDLPMTITSVQLTGAQANQYSHDGTPGTVIAPNSTGQICVTYRPTSSMAAAATLTVGTNGTPGTFDVPINGIATGVGEEQAFVLGYRLGQSVPNPAREEATIQYTLPAGGVVLVELYNAVGKSVMTVVANEYRGAGTHSISVPVQQLESGAYVYRLTVNGYTISKMLQVVK